MNEYYTPEIEDLRVGYEFYEPVLDFSSTGSPKKFKKIILGEGENYKAAIQERTTVYLPFPEFIKVARLTKEQIEEEGWEIKGGEKGTSNENNFWFEKGNYGGKILEDGRIVIIAKDVLLDEYTERTSNGQLYLGKCHSINEWRQIIKLLGI